jgi:hypothetical protein
MPFRLLVGSNAEHLPAGRGRGRPVGADSVETRSRILRAARDLIHERDYEAANFMAMFLGKGIYAGFIVDSIIMPVVAEQLRQ